MSNQNAFSLFEVLVCCFLCTFIIEFVVLQFNLIDKYLNYLWSQLLLVRP
jgi:hypothetical protein